jgi:sarcosine oxidase subunit delta
MFRLTCPHCGPRDDLEFTYGGDATVETPALDADEETWFKAVYHRDNPRGPHLEYWHHVAGCRQWIRIRRDTLTHEVLAYGAATGPMSDEGGSGEQGA